MSGFFGKWLKVSLVVLVGASFVAVVVYALLMKDEIRTAQVEPPLIAAPEAPVKMRPDDPGGMDIPNRDKVVFDLLDASSSTPVSGETPVGEQPKQPVVVSSDVVDVSSVKPVPPVTTANVAKSGKLEDVVVSPSLTLAKVVEPQRVSSSAPVVALAKKPVVVSKTEMVTKALEKEPVSEEKLAPKKEGSSAQGGKWGVQLAAVGSRADGDKAVKTLTSKYPLLKGFSAKVVQAGSKFRVQFWGLKDRAAAAGVCAKVSPCFPVAP